MPKKLICEDEVNIAVANWLKVKGAVNVKRLTGQAQGNDVEAVLDGKQILVESKGETPNEPDKTHAFDGSQIDSHISRQVFKVLELRQQHPDAIIFIANPENDKIRYRFNKVSQMLKKLDIGALWVRSDMAVCEGEYQEDDQASVPIVNTTEQLVYRLSKSFEEPSKNEGITYSGEQLGGHKFGIALAVLFPDQRITETTIRRCLAISGSFPEASEMHKYLTNQGGSKRIESWVQKHGGREKVLEDGHRMLENNPTLKAAIKDEVELLLKGRSAFS